jgi:hypothetical protein
VSGLVRHRAASLGGMEVLMAAGAHLAADPSVLLPVVAASDALPPLTEPLHRTLHFYRLRVNGTARHRNWSSCILGLGLAAAHSDPRWALTDALGEAA